MSLFMLICCEICFVAIYAVLAQNLFCRDLRTFVWRKIYSEIVLVETKGQISGMFQRKVAVCHKSIFLFKGHTSIDLKEKLSQANWCDFNKVYDDEKQPIISSGCHCH